MPTPIRVWMTDEYEGSLQKIALDQDLPWSTSLGSGVVPKGTVVNLESYPWFLRWLLPRMGRGARASIVHDDIYKRKLYDMVTGNKIMLELMQQDGWNDGRKWLIYWGLQLYWTTPLRYTAKKESPEMWAFIKKQQLRAASQEQIAEVVNMRATGQALKPLSDQDWINEAVQLSVPPERLKALHAFESANKSRDSQGRLIIAHETHVFARNCSPKGKFNKSHPRISTQNFVNVRFVASDHYHPMRLNNTQRWDLVAQAMELDAHAALCAISMGRFQILGEGYKKLGFNSPLDLLRYMNKGDRAELDVALRFMRWKGIFEAFRQGDMHTFMKGWNGSAQVKWAVTKFTEHEQRYAKRFVTTV